MDYVAVKDVPLVSVGMAWPASTGPVTFQFEHLADMQAAEADPHITSPRLKIGHTDSRFEPEGGLGTFDPTWDGDPVFGTATNLRLTNDGAVLVGDFEQVPAWLADAMPSMFPSRSVEAVWETKSYSGKTYSAVLTAVALLGPWAPAVQDLPDLIRLATVGPDLEGEPVEVTAGDVAAAKVRSDAPAGVAAAADVDKVIDTFYRDFATEDSGRYWWWVRSAWMDPDVLYVDDDEGHIQEVAVSTSPTGDVTFGEPTEVRQQFVAASTGDAVPAVSRDDRPVAVYASRNDDRLPNRQEPSSMSDPAATEPEVDLAALRTRLELSDDATIEEVNAALLAEQAAPSTEDEVEPPAEVPAVEPEPIAASAEPEVVQISAAQLAELQRDAREGAAARSEQVNERRLGITASAVADGRIAPAERDAWLSKISDTDPAVAAAAEETLNGLAKGLIPVDRETGSSAGVPEAAQMAAINDLYGLNPDGTPRK